MVFVINFTDMVFVNRFKSNVSPQSIALKFFFYKEITDFRYFRNMISFLISQLYFDVILFNQKILIVLDSCLRSSFFIIWVLFGTFQSLNRLPYQIKKNIAC